ncbi:carbohydrate sulfotransferase 11 [Eurytemora carolleeae]|uniref:carbohydrate sulfotransferase 11 n=1 Tax=Eurytemora carolleeae TaxID=1294199 RepID=UPI000C76D6B9|nr:carbohydrate sulfotransferase 11 [Eurytemora carolleeae]|eukprot:XP_023325989.1 carbohydrate sulfotransferase 11-like [Eurytemora affinis]
MQFPIRESMFRRYVPNQSEESINGEFRAKSIIKPASFDQSNRSNIQTNGSNNKPNTLSEFNLESWLRTQSVRTSLIHEVCKNHSDLIYILYNDKFMYDDKHNLLYCRQAKVGTSTWLSLFLDLSDSLQEEKDDISFTSKRLHAKVPNMFPLPPNLDVSDLSEISVSFSMVRHPLERLVSAYLDKMVDKTDLGFLNLRDRIIEKYGNVNFESFVRHIVDSKSFLCRSISSCHYDVHWLPQVARCFYCQVPYKYILKLETFKDDLQGISLVSNIKLPLIRKHVSSGNTRELTKRYMRSLPTNLTEEILRVYREDFEMFDYDPNLYLD